MSLTTWTTKSSHQRIYSSIHIKTGTQVLTEKKGDEKTDSIYQIEEINTADKLLESWEKIQRHLDQF